MNLLLFCTAFIFQFVGHRIGDYLFQTDWQAQNKTKNAYARFKHCVVYSLTIAILIGLGFNWKIGSVIFCITFLEHFWIDSRKPIVSWKTFLEKRIAGQQSFDIANLPLFVLIEIDQTVHYMRIFLLSLGIGYGII